MSTRRAIDRRRRVLYSTCQADPSAVTSRQAERLRQARKPVAAYGDRVQRRLNGRWYSLVPASRKSMSIATGAVLVLSATLTLGHAASVSVTSLATRSDITSALRLDRGDSLGNWWMTIAWMLTAGIALLTYQLRRYRLDDYRGQYRLWRLILIVCVLFSINQATPLTQLIGGLIEWAADRRIGLSGKDWTRMALTIGLTAIALRTLFEVRRSRLASISLVVAALMAACFQAADWQIIEPATVTQWVLLSSLPLWVTTAVVIGLAGYLRMLYREVNEIEDEIRWRETLLWFRSPWSPIDDQAAADAEADSRPDSDDTQIDDNDVKDPQPKRRWFGLRRAAGVLEHDKDPADPKEKPAKPVVQRRTGRKNPANAPEPAVAADDSEIEENANSKKRRFLSRRRKADTDDRDHGEPIDASGPPNESDESIPKRRAGLRKWLRSSKNTLDDDNDSETGRADSPDALTATGNDQATRESQEGVNSSDRAGDFEDDNDFENIDWDSLSKSERRRLRKRMKRSGRAA